MEELKQKIAEYDKLFDELIQRALNDDIEKDSKDWDKLDVIKDEIITLAKKL